MPDAPDQILEAAQMVGRVFRPIAGAHQIILGGFPGGRCVVEMKLPVQINNVDVWVPTNAVFHKK